MDRADIYFVISITLEILAFFGIEWTHIKSYLAAPKQEGTMVNIPFPKRQITYAVLVFAGLVASSIGWYTTYDAMNTASYREWFEDRKVLAQVLNRHFSPDDVIELDGKNIHDCSFDSSTLIYRGKRPFYWNHNTMAGYMKIKVVDGPGQSAAGLMMILMTSHPCLPGDQGKGKCDLYAVDQDLKPMPEHF
jgi:hypothetical protein